MIFRLYKIASFYNSALVINSIICLCLVFVSILGYFINGSTFINELCGLSFIILTTILVNSKRYKRSPFSPIFTFFTVLFLNIPIAFILFKGANYSLGISVGELPYTLDQYFDDLSIALSYLFFSWISIWLGLITLNNNKRYYKIVDISASSIIIVGVLVLVFNYINNGSIINVRVNGGEHSFSILAFLFSDNAYLLLAATILNISLNNINKNLNIFGIIYISFICLFFVSGSKAAPLIVSFLMILLPASFLLSTNLEYVIFIKKRFIIAIILISPILFYLANYKRLQYASGVEVSIGGLIAHFINVNLMDIIYSLDAIFYRLTWGGLDQYIIIFKSFIIEDYPKDNINSIIIYLLENLINLVLPGTPFPDSFFPTSQIFYKIINQLPLNSIFDKTAIITKANNQPFTIFGFFIIIFGIFSPLFLYFFSLSFSLAMNLFSNIYIKLIFVYTFLNMLSMFGFEVIVANSIQILISICFIGLLLKTLRLNINFK